MLLLLQVVLCLLLLVPVLLWLRGVLLRCLLLLSIAAASVG